MPIRSRPPPLSFARLRAPVSAGAVFLVPPAPLAPRVLLLALCIACAPRRAFADCVLTPPAAASGSVTSQTRILGYSGTDGSTGMVWSATQQQSTVRIELPATLMAGGMLVVETCLTEWDTMLVVSPVLDGGLCPANATPADRTFPFAAGNDDAGAGSGCGNTLQSRVEVEAVPGAAYAVLLQGFNNHGGPFTLGWRLASATPTPSATQSWGIPSPSSLPTLGPPVCLFNASGGSSVSSDTRGARIGLAGVYEGVVYHGDAAQHMVVLTVPAAQPWGGHISVSTCGGADWDTVLLISRAEAPGAACLLRSADFRCIASNDDDTGCIPQSTAIFPAEPGVSYVVLISGYGVDDGGPFTLTWDYIPPTSIWPLVFALAGGVNLVIAVIVGARWRSAQGGR